MYKPPPFFIHKYGNLHTLLSPTVYPISDSRYSLFLVHTSLCGRPLSLVATLPFNRSISISSSMRSVADIVNGFIQTGMEIVCISVI